MRTVGLFLLSTLGAVFSLFGCAPVASAEPSPTGMAAVQAKLSKPAAKGGSLSKDIQELVVGAGCFWCVEVIFEELKGVEAVESGYAGGEEKNPTYEMVGSGFSRHAEVIKITYDAKQISGEDLLRVFFTVHDPTTKDRQGGDVGPQYRSAIFYANEAERVRAQKIKDEITKEKVWKNPIVTTLEPLKNYATAEDYHQDYFKKWEKATPAQRAKMNNGYCQVIIDPKVQKFREKFAARLKTKGE